MLRNKIILRYFIKSIFAFIFLFAGYTQALAQFPSDAYHGLRIGMDLSRIPIHFIKDYRTDLNFHADLKVDTNLYIAAETGWNKTELNNKPAFSYKSNGIFLKAGIDYNLLNPSFPFESNMVFVGVRYGIARMDRAIPSYQIEYPYWGDVKGEFPYKTITPQWGEATLGMKVEVFNNLFLSWGLHLRMLITRNFDNGLRPYLIPGFGVATSNVVFDVNYNISYRIPLWRPKPKPKEDKKEKEKSKLQKELDKKENQQKQNAANKKKNEEENKAKNS
ncbi:MAG TPA: DUF6048 family protein [Chitinophagaceae bacterium]|nr:DUF6048 family protein [Chitinophagaceae bacterium]